MLSEIMCRRIFQQRRQQESEKKAQQQRRGGACTRTHGWAKSCGARPRSARPSGGGGGGPPPLHRPRKRPPRPALALRPVYAKGTRARGMRAPENTNQFLMHEKYQLLRMRSDSVGSEPELSDMDSYLGVLENARGALLDSPEPVGPRGPPGASGPRTGTRTDPEGAPQEDSLQYFPSEDDLQQSSRFMQRDFVEFCGFLGP